jgi:hypothetical protein
MNIGTLMATLGVDTKGLDVAAQRMKDFGFQVSTQTTRMQSTLGNLRTSYIAVAAAVTTAVMVGKRFIEAAMEQEEAEHALAMAMKARGDYTKDAHRALVDYSSEIQRTTAFSDEAVLSIMANLKAFSMSTEEMKKATQATIDLATAKRMDLWSASQLVGKSYVGMTTALRRAGIEIDDSIPKSKKFAAALAAINEHFGGRAQAQLDTYIGQWQHMKNVWGEISERVGFVLLKILEGLTAQLALDAAMFQRLFSVIAGGLAAVYDLMSLLPGKMGNFFEDMTLGADATAKKYDDLAKSSWNFGIKHFDMMLKGQKETHDSFGAMGDDLEKFGGVSQKVLDEYEKKNTEVIEALIKATDTEKGYKIYQLNEWYNEAMKIYDKAGKDTTFLVAAYAAQKAAILKEEAEKESDFMKSVTEEAAKSMQSTISDFFFTAVNGDMKDFEALWKSFANTLVRIWSDAMSKMVIKLLGLQKLLEGEKSDEGLGGLLSGLLGGAAKWGAGLFGGGGGAGDMGSAGGDILGLGGLWMGKGGIFPGEFMPIQHFAAGGIARRPTIGMIGENRKPEAVIPLPDGRSVPVQFTGGGNSEERPVTIININAVDAQSFAELCKRNPSAIIQPVLENVKHGGSMRYAFKETL